MIANGNDLVEGKTDNAKEGRMAGTRYVGGEGHWYGLNMPPSIHMLECDGIRKWGFGVVLRPLGWSPHEWD